MLSTAIVTAATTTKGEPYKIPYYVNTPYPLDYQTVNRDSSNTLRGFNP